eukprot:jgi/Mesvir1/10374/Mv10574-RA.1
MSSAVWKRDVMLTLNCPVSEAFPLAGVNRPVFSYRDPSSTARVLAGVLAYDNACHEIAGAATVVVPPHAALSDDDKRAIDLIARLLARQYALDGATFVEMPSRPAGVSSHVNITTGNSNGPVPLFDFLSADATLSRFHAIPMADGGTAYVPKLPSAAA